ncbi:MAG: hypothetical protein IT186_04030 [Acidobacteria bacterium]|nr:hypothetical protein [Acidobacteriota bacterium]
MNPGQALAGDLAILYAGVDRPEAWTEWLARTAASLRLPFIGQQAYSFVEKRGSGCCLFGDHHSTMHAYNAYYGARNPWMPRARATLQPGRPIVSDELCAESELYRTEFYADWLRPARLLHSMGAVLAIENGTSHTMAFLRGPDAGPYTQEEIRYLTSVLPHLQNVFRLRARLSALEAVRDSFSHALDRLGYGVVLIDGIGRVVSINAAARETLGKQDGLRLSRDQLRTTSPATEGALERLLRCGTSLSAETESPVNGVVEIPRLRSPLPLEVTAFPLLSETMLLGISASVIVFIHDPDLSRPVPETWLKQRFRLTGGEIRVARMLAAGSTLPEISDQLEISIQTARTHLKRIFAKTDTSRQSDLSRRLLRSLANLAGTDPAR